MTSAILKPEDGYATNPAESSMVFQAVPGIYFYIRMLGTVFSAARRARKKKYTSEDWIQSSLAIIRHLEKVDCRFFIQGRDNFLNLEGPCVFVANHMSTLETFALGSIIRPHRPVTFVVKDSLVRYPVFKHVMISRDPIVVSRKNPRQDFRAVMEQGSEKLNQGKSIIIFPQAVRAKGIDPEKFNSIGVKLARKAQVPVVPLALKTDAWGTGRFIRDFGRIRPEKLIHFAFAQPMAIKGRGKKEHKKIFEFIQARLNEWSRLEKQT